MLESKDKKLVETLTRQLSLEQLQDYMRRMVRERGFVQETPRDTMLLLVEEVGELAKALRKHIGLKIDQEKVEAYGALKHELADVLILLLVLSNSCDVDLFEALHDKERKNSLRTWRAHASVKNP